MRKILPKTLYLKIAAVFAMILLFLGSLQLYVYVNNWIGFLQEAEQRAHWGVAEQLARKIEPLVADRLHPEPLEQLLSQLLLPPARIELYLLDAEGAIRFHQAMPARIQRSSVSLVPIREFIERKHVGGGAILGDDPTDAKKKVIFSAWPISIVGSPGYLYAVLAADPYERIVRRLGERYLLDATSVAALLSLGAAMIAGLLAFYYLTQPLKRLTEAVAAFQRGDFSARIDSRSGDELETLGETFNTMAQTIEQKIEELKQQDELRRELVANISHDLRSPVAAVRSSLDTIVLQFDSLRPQEVRAYLEASIHSLDFLQTLVTELFELSKLEAGAVEPKREPFSLGELCDDIVNQLRPQAARKQLSLELSAADEHDVVAADIGMISKVLVNLVENAIRYSEGPGVITVEVTPGADAVVTAVRDRGMGIPAEALPRIFDRFYRVEQSRERSKGGTGLGLAIVKRIIEAHGASIQVESTVGEGTTFSFALPRHR